MRGRASERAARTPASGSGTGVAARTGGHPDYDREARLRARLEPAPEPASRRPVVDPVASIPWSAARDAVGLEASVIIEISAEVLVSWVRDVVGWEAFGITANSY